MAVGASEVEAWLEQNQEWTHEYFLKKLDITLVNKWLILHGFHTLQDYITGRRGSLSQDSSEQTSPVQKTDCGFFNDKEAKPQRTNSKKYLRHDFAKARARSIFRTHEPSSSSSDQAVSLAERRSSLKGMRQFFSLPPTTGNMLSMLIQSKVRLPRYASKDEELKRELRSANERDFFLEIVRDISHDLDLKSLTSRILVNICILVDADRSSMFFVEGPRGNQALVSKVFDAYTGTNCIPTSKGDNIVRIPWGHGIIGHVAQSGDIVNITHASQDPRYKDDVDKIVGYKTDSLLCMPIRNADDIVIGVAQVANKSSRENHFTKDDEKLLDTYLAFCGMAITNAQAIESYSKEYDQNKALLEAAHDLFEEQTSVESVVIKIMQRAQSLLKCERCIVILNSNNNYNPEKPGFDRIFDLQQPTRNGQSRLKPASNSRLGVIYEPDFDVRVTVSTLEKKDKTCFHTKSILCKPIRDNNLQTIGVAQLINKLDGRPFDENDDQLFEAFTIFCGLGINNCLLYDEVARASAKQAVALEVLSYHATVSADTVVSFKNKELPGISDWKLNKLDFDDFSLNHDEMVLAAIRMFINMGLVKTFKIEYETLVQWMLTVQKNYRTVAYHNWRHAFNVCQFMHSLLSSTDVGKHFSDVECLTLLVACLCHDLDHRGTNNAFQQKTSSALSQLYGTQATLENHHFNHAVMILNSENHNIFANLSSDDYSKVMKLLKHAILATDLSLHIQVRRKLFPIVECGEQNWNDPAQRELLRSVAMTTCDIATITKPWEIQKKAADLVVTEFFDQGDKERTVLKIQPQALMDRERRAELPRLQIEWIDGIGLPLYKTLGTLDNQLQVLVDRVMINRNNWKRLEKESTPVSTNKSFKETAC